MGALRHHSCGRRGRTPAPQLRKAWAHSGTTAAEGVGALRHHSCGRRGHTPAPQLRKAWAPTGTTAAALALFSC
ncbi:hypothetical protein NDU88_000374 [Pleurodeles waltl]|uniref:Uncharacterized protein n=1 Tax=Pleurodeles waltl TaxID=8319 RepID=A0AAV7MRN1_PLEWA|nr:hypothetical protein NDU88_000374 [Pleurodeles waltl]